MKTAEEWRTCLIFSDAGARTTKWKGNIEQMARHLEKVPDAVPTTREDLRVAERYLHLFATAWGKVKDCLHKSSLSEKVYEETSKGINAVVESLQAICSQNSGFEPRDRSGGGRKGMQTNKRPSDQGHGALSTPHDRPFASEKVPSQSSVACTESQTANPVVDGESLHSGMVEKQSLWTMSTRPEADGPVDAGSYKEASQEPSQSTSYRTIAQPFMKRSQDPSLLAHSGCAQEGRESGDTGSMERRSSPHTDETSFLSALATKPNPCEESTSASSLPADIKDRMSVSVL
jgi:hypothetical protein